MTSLIFRCDASNAIGSGHVIRCLTLARELRRSAVEVTFIARRHPGDLIGLLQEEFPVLILPSRIMQKNGELQGRMLYQTWLGCEQEVDADDCIKVITESDISNPSWLVVDHYGLDKSWEKHMLKHLSTTSRPQLLAIDDLADRPHEANMLLDQNFPAQAGKNRYRGLVGSDCRMLLGPHYALLGPDYARLHKEVPKRTGINKVLVYFGGVDTNNITGKVVEVLREPAFEYLDVDIVLGHQATHWEEVKQQSEIHPRTRLHSTMPSLANLIAEADLAIGACGSTSWERSCLGLPALVITTAENQVETAKYLADKGNIRCVGNEAAATKDRIRTELSDILSGRTFGSSFARLSDGLGARRVVSAMLVQVE